MTSEKILLSIAIVDLPSIIRKSISPPRVMQKYFFVGLSHKFWKNWEILEAFDSSTISGKLLHNIIPKNDISSIYFTNLVHGVPLDKQGKLRYPTTKEKQQAFIHLQDKIHHYQPQKIFLFWKEVADFIIKELKAKTLSKDTFIYQNTIIYSLEHPAYMSIYKKKELNLYEQKIRKFLTE